jgi:hypothetical protein
LNTDNKQNKNKSQSLVQIMTEEEIKKIFIPKLKSSTKNFFSILHHLILFKKIPHSNFFFVLSKESDNMEIFLDDYGARNNQKFYYFGELVASIRWISIAISYSTHILSRINSYKLFWKNEEKEKFISDLENEIKINVFTLKIFAKEILSVSKEMDIFSPYEKEIQENEKPIKKILPADIYQKTISETKERIFDILMKFLEIGEKFEMFMKKRDGKIKPTEEILEDFRSSFHRLQALYDTYIKNTDIEEKISFLTSLRGQISVNLYLFEIGRALIHLDERHTKAIESLSSQRPMLKNISCNKIQDEIKNFILLYTEIFTQKGKELAENIFTELNSNPDEYILETVFLQIPYYRLEDFHIRPIMPITQIAQKYSINSYLYFNRTKYDLKSPLEMAIAIPDIRETLSKENVDIIIQGPKKSVKEIVEFLKNACGAFYPQESIKDKEIISKSSD